MFKGLKNKARLLKIEVYSIYLAYKTQGFLGMHVYLRCALLAMPLAQLT